MILEAKMPFPVLFKNNLVSENTIMVIRTPTTNVLVADLCNLLKDLPHTFNEQR